MLFKILKTWQNLNIWKQKGLFVFSGDSVPVL